jgi:hypothetical protein
MHALALEARADGARRRGDVGGKTDRKDRDVPTELRNPALERRLRLYRLLGERGDVAKLRRQASSDRQNTPQESRHVRSKSYWATQPPSTAKLGLSCE